MERNVLGLETGVHRRLDKLCDAGVWLVLSPALDQDFHTALPVMVSVPSRARLTPAHPFYSTRPETKVVVHLRRQGSLMTKAKTRYGPRFFTTAFYNCIYGGLLATFPPEEERKLRGAMKAALCTIPALVYKAHPRIPRLRRRLLLKDYHDRTYLLILKDNLSAAAVKTVIERIDLDGVREMLGLGGQKPKRYPVSFEGTYCQHTSYSTWSDRKSYIPSIMSKSASH